MTEIPAPDIAAEAMPKKKSGGCLLPAIGAAVLLGGGAAAYWMLNRTSPDRLTASANVAMLPDETIAVAHLSTAHFEDLAQFGTPEAQAEIQQRLQNTLARLSPDLDWERDLKPWLGSVTLGVATAITDDDPDADSNANPNADPDLYAIIGVRDKIQALQFARNLQGQAEAPPIESEYEGVTLLEIEREIEPSATTVLAQVEGYWLVTDSVDTMHNAIDDIQANTTALSNEGLKQLVAQGAGIDRPLLEIYIPDTAAFAPPQTKTNADPETGEDTSELPAPPAIRASIATLRVTDSGLHGNVQLLFNDRQAPPQLVPLVGAPETQFPESTLALLTGNNLAQAWTEYAARAEGAGALPQTQQTVAALRGTLKQIGLDADRDVFGWMDGEAAIGAFPVSTGLLQQFGLAAAATVDTSDRATATATLDKVSAAIKQRLPLPLSQKERQIGEVTLKEWSVPVPGLGAGGFFGYGWRNDRQLLIGLSAPALDAIADPQSATLDANPTFQVIMQALPSDKAGYAYINLAQLHQQLQSIPIGVNQFVTPETMTLLGATRGWGATAASTADDRLTIDLALALQPFTTTEPPEDGASEPPIK